jgi:hypothetical protein
MVIKYLLFLLTFSISTACFSKSICTKSDGIEPSLCQIKLPKIAKVVIKKNAAGKTPSGSIQDYDICEKFILSPSGVKRYFRETKLFNETDFHLYKNVTPCHASGTLVFTDGRKAIWDIDAYKNGTLKIENKKEIYLLCEKCNFKPW